MRRKITRAIVGVATAIVLALGLPLAVAVHSSILDSEVVELQASAARTLTEIDVPLDPARMESISGETDSSPRFSVYDTTGHRVFGDGPVIADDVTMRSLQGATASSTDAGIVVATPITQRSNESLAGALRISESMSEVNRRIRLAWLVMAGAGLAALTVGWIIARRVAGRLSNTLTELSAAATVFDHGNAAAASQGAFRRVPRSGIAELDSLADVLADSADRVNQSLARERRFSADVSHQLRTPLTGLRLHLEAGRAANPDAMKVAFDDLDRIDQTVQHLLAFARDAIPAGSVVRLDDAAERAARRWRERAHVGRRTVTAVAGPALTTAGAAGSVDQILDVLIDNALRHGAGTVTVTPRSVYGGGAIDVADEGRTLNLADESHVFTRGEGQGTGIGLSLARSLAEAEQGRLILLHAQPTTFSLILLEPDPPTAQP